MNSLKWGFMQMEDVFTYCCDEEEYLRRLRAHTGALLTQTETLGRREIQAKGRESIEKQNMANVTSLQ